MSSSLLTGSVRLARYGVHRDRVLLAVWTVLLIGVCYASATATEGLYPTTAERVRAAEAINASPAVVALYGPILDVRSLGEVAMTKMTVTYALFVMVMCLVVVRRHARTEEENGQTELIGGTAVGRASVLGSAVLEGVAASVVVGLLAAAVDVAGGLPAQGSLAFGATWIGIGLVATGLTAVACQLSASSRTCAAIAAGMLGAAYALRAVGDTTAQWLSWLSPLGWNTRLRAWSDPRWWVLLLYPLLFAALVALAAVLRTHRDLGSGIFPASPGPAHGSPRLSDAVALSLRVHTPALVTWSVAAAALGVLFGAIAPNIGSMLDSATARQMMQRLGGVGAVEDTLLAAMLSVSAVVLTCFSISVVAHGATDEHDGRTEQVLATAIPRGQSFAAMALVSLLGGAWLLVVTGLALTAGYGVQAGDPGAFGRLLAAALAQAPALWVVAGVTLLSHALRSAWTFVGWVLLVGFVVVGQVAELLDLPSWVSDLSPYSHVPQLPGGAADPGSLVALTVIALALVLGAWWRYRARDIG